MALTVIKHSMTTQRTSTATTYEAVTGGTIAGASLKASTKYAVLTRWLGNFNNSTQTGYYRLYSADDATLETFSENSFGIAGHQGQGRFTVAVMDTAATPTDIIAQFKVDASGTITVDDLQILLIDLDDLGASNWLHDSGTPGTEAPTAWGTVFSTLAGADLGIATEWLIFGQARMNDSGGLYFKGGRLYAANGSDTAALQMEHWIEGEESTAQPGFQLMGLHKTLTGEEDVTLQLAESSGIANAYIYNHQLFAIKTAVFDTGTVVAQNNTATEATSGTETTMETLDTIVGGAEVVVISAWQKTRAGANPIGAHVEDGLTPLKAVDLTRYQSQAADGGGVEAETAYTMDFVTDASASPGYSLRGRATDTVTNGGAVLFFLVLAASAGGGGASEFNTHVGRGVPLLTGG